MLCKTPWEICFFTVPEQNFYLKFKSTLSTRNPKILTLLFFFYCVPIIVIVLRNNERSRDIISISSQFIVHTLFYSVVVLILSDTQHISHFLKHPKTVFIFCPAIPNCSLLFLNPAIFLTCLLTISAPSSRQSSWIFFKCSFSTYPRAPQTLIQFLEYEKCLIIQRLMSTCFWNMAPTCNCAKICRTRNCKQ